MIFCQRRDAALPKRHLVPQLSQWSDLELVGGFTALLLFRAQGYKFNIFYPDLLNPTEAPRYFFENDPNGSRDTMILRFNAGPPYEDIAFRCPRSDRRQSNITSAAVARYHAAKGHMAMSISWQ